MNIFSYKGNEKFINLKKNSEKKSNFFEKKQQNQKYLFEINQSNPIQTIHNFKRKY